MQFSTGYNPTLDHPKLKQLAATIYKMPKVRYLAYIRSVVWQRVRREHIERCDGFCEICLWRRAIQVHHTTYVRLGYELPQDLCAVCVDCHHKLHCLVGPPPANDNEKQIPLPLEETG